MQCANRNLIPAALERHGKSPNILVGDVTMQDDDCLEGGQRLVMFTFHQGEACTCPSRMKTARNWVEPVERGRPLDLTTSICGQASREQLETVLRIRAVGRRARDEMMPGHDRQTKSLPVNHSSKAVGFF